MAGEAISGAHVMTTMDSIRHELWDLHIKQKYYILSIFTFFTILACFDFKIGKEAYFYTLSTISQTLAALIGIIAIFVIFKLDRLKTERSDSFENLKRMCDSLDHGNLMGEFHMDKYYSKIHEVVKKQVLGSLTDEVLLTMLSDAIGNFVINEEHSEVTNSLIEGLKNMIDKIHKIDRHIENIPRKFGSLTIVIFIPIILSILALPLGWFIVPIDILSNLSILKLPFVVYIVYLTIVSIFQTKQFLDYAINSND